VTVDADAVAELTIENFFVLIFGVVSVFGLSSIVDCVG
jgi:hypothetical protein